MKVRLCAREEGTPRVPKDAPVVKFNVLGLSNCVKARTEIGSFKREIYVRHSYVAYVYYGRL